MAKHANENVVLNVKTAILLEECEVDEVHYKVLNDVCNDEYSKCEV